MSKGNFMSKIFGIILVFVMVGLMLAPVQASGDTESEGTSQWTTNGPPGAYISSLAMAPTNLGIGAYESSQGSGGPTPPALIVDFDASDEEDSQSTLSWTNPDDADLAQVLVNRQTGSYPVRHADGTTYYYAAFSRDSDGNWNDTVQPGSNADTGAPNIPEEYEYPIMRPSQDEEGRQIDMIIVPGRPPEIKAPVATVPEPNPAMGINTLSNVPAFDWCYGCSATSAAMMFGHYDNHNYTNMYAGPTNGGVCPMNNSVWGSGECPLSATHLGYDGLGQRGHVDDYWYSYGSSRDPYYDGNWTQHTYANCTADYMGTNQYHNWQNTDGSTRFFYYRNGDPLYDYSGHEPAGYRDGCHGVRLFVESCGYSVVTNYNQYIKGQAPDDPNNGFTFSDFQSEIDAGRPVLIQVEGHTMLGYGYNTTGQVIYIHDTWDYSDHQMTWGGSYNGHQHYAVNVIELQDAGQGWPQHYSNIGPVSVGDIDNDGKLEIVATVDHQNGLRIGIGVWEHNGSIKEGFPVHLEGVGGGGAIPPVAIGDVDNDGELEIATGYGWNSWKIYVIDNNGSVLDGWPQGNGGSPYPVSGFAVLEDLDDDGYLEILAGGKRLNVWEYNGTNVTGFPKAIHCTSPAVGDINNDGELEIVTLTQTNLFVFNVSGGELLNISLPASTYAEPPVLANVIGDDDLEILFSLQNGKVYAYNLSGQLIKTWSFLDSETANSPVIGDIDGDGDLEIFLSTYVFQNYAKIYGWDHNDNNLPGWPITLTDVNRMWSTPILGDIDGDGNSEVVIGGTELGEEHLYAWHSNGTLVEGWPKNLAPQWGYGIMGSAVIEDIDRDGDTEIIVSTNSYVVDITSIYVWDLNVTYNPGNIEWGMFQHDMCHTGCYEFGVGEPILCYSPTSHDFGDRCEGETDDTTFKIWNCGSGTLSYSLSESCNWVDVHPTSGSSTGEHDTITVDIDTSGLSLGSQTCPISISSNDGDGTFTVTVNVIPCPCSVHLEASQDNAATVNKGNITFDDTNYPLPEDISVAQGNYSATYNPESGYEFKNWSMEGNVSVLDPNSQTTTVNVSCGGTLRAIYKQIQYTLTTNVSPSGSGYVELNPPGGVYSADTVVNLTAINNTGWEFDQWSGTDNNDINPTTVTMDSNKTVTAYFAVVQGWSFEIQPNVTKVGFNQDFTVNATVTRYSGESDSYVTYVQFNGTLLDVTGVDTPATLPNGMAPFVITPPSWDNTTGWVRAEYCKYPGSANINETFTFCTIHFRTGSLNGTSYVNFTTIDPVKTTVVMLGGVDYLNWAHVVNGTVEVVPGATLQGNVTFVGRDTAPNDKWIEDFVVRGFEPGNLSNVLWTGNATTNASGVFIINGLAPGTYDISIKNWTCLSEVNTSVTLTAGNTTVVDFGTTREGDANNDDWVVMADLSLLLPAWNKDASDPAYSGHYDFNRDGYVTMADLSLMLPNWNQHGDLV